MASLTTRPAILLAATTLTGPVLAREASAQRDEISVEAQGQVAVPDTNLTASFAGFDIVRNSILRQETNNIADQVANGAVGSKDFEAGRIANFAPGTNLTLSYTHLDFRFLRQTSPVNGGPSAVIPCRVFRATRSRRIWSRNPHPLRGPADRRRHPPRRHQLRR